MILCGRSTSRSREQSTRRTSCSERIRKVCLFYGQNNNCMIIKHGRQILSEIHVVRKGLWAFFLGCAFRRQGRQTQAVTRLTTRMRNLMGNPPKVPPSHVRQRSSNSEDMNRWRAIYQNTVLLYLVAVNPIAPFLSHLKLVCVLLGTTVST